MQKKTNSQLRLAKRCKHTKREVKPERGSDGGYNLTNQSVQVGVRWPLNVQVPATDVIDGLVVHHKGTV